MNKKELDEKITAILYAWYGDEIELEVIDLITKACAKHYASIFLERIEELKDYSFTVEKRICKEHGFCHILKTFKKLEDIRKVISSYDGSSKNIY